MQLGLCKADALRFAICVLAGHGLVQGGRFKPHHGRPSAEGNRNALLRGSGGQGLMSHFVSPARSSTSIPAPHSKLLDARLPFKGAWKQGGALIQLCFNGNE